MIAKPAIYKQRLTLKAISLKMLRDDWIARRVVGLLDNMSCRRIIGQYEVPQDYWTIRGAPEIEITGTVLIA